MHVRLASAMSSSRATATHTLRRLCCAGFPAATRPAPLLTTAAATTPTVAPAFYSTAAGSGAGAGGDPSKKPSLVALVARLRKETECAMHEARAALLQAGGDYDAALALVRRQAGEVGEGRLAKLAARVSGREGLVGVWSSAAATTAGGARAALIEVHCETDFVARGEAFGALVARLGAELLARGAPAAEGSAAAGRIAVCGVDVGGWLDEAPVAGATVTEAATGDAAWDADAATVGELVRRVVGKVGEAAVVRRAEVVEAGAPTLSSSELRRRVVGVYAHGRGGASPRGTGRMAAAVVVEVPAAAATGEPTVSAAVGAFADRLAQHVAGFGPLVVGNGDEAGLGAEELAERVLLRQPFVAGGGSVAEVLAARATEWGGDVTVVGFRRFELGERIQD